MCNACPLFGIACLLIGIVRANLQAGSTARAPEIPNDGRVTILRKSLNLDTRGSHIADHDPAKPLNRGQTRRAAAGRVRFVRLGDALSRGLRFDPDILRYKINGEARYG